MLVVYAGLIGLTGCQFVQAPTGFIPQQDQGYLITIVQLPPGASLARTDEVVRKVTQDRARHAGRRPCRAVRRLRRRHLHQRAQRRRVFAPLEAVRGARREGPERASPHRRAQQAIRCRSRKRSSSACRRRRCAASAPAAASRWMVQDSHGGGLPQLEAVAQSIVGAGQPDAGPRRRLHPLQHARRRRSMPTSTASGPRCWASRPTTCSRRWRSISARPMSTTSIFWAAPTGSPRRPTATSARTCATSRN